MIAEHHLLMVLHIRYTFFFYSETNLKCRQCLVEVAELAHEVVKFDGFIRCETPNNLLNKFHGILQWNNKEYVHIEDKYIFYAYGCGFY